MSTNVPAAIALLVIALLGVFADYQNRVVFEQRLRAETLAKVNLVRAKLEGNINGNIQLVRGLVSTLMTEPDMTQDALRRSSRATCSRKTASSATSPARRTSSCR